LYISRSVSFPAPFSGVIIVNENKNRNENYLIQSTEMGMRSRNYFENEIE